MRTDGGKNFGRFTEIGETYCLVGVDPAIPEDEVPKVNCRPKVCPIPIILQPGTVVLSAYSLAPGVALEPTL